MGTLGFSATCPFTCTLPLKDDCRASARTANAEVVLWAGTHVAVQVALPIASIESGASPLLKLTATDPLFTATPQLSTTCTASGVGHAAGVVKPVPMVVNTGSSLVGVHPVARGSASCPATMPAVGEITSSKSTVCVLLSLNVSLIDPR